MFYCEDDIFVKTLKDKYPTNFFMEVLMKYFDDLMAFKIQKKFREEKECVEYIDKVIPILKEIDNLKNERATMIYYLFDKEDKETRDRVVNIETTEIENKLVNKYEELRDI